MSQVVEADFEILSNEECKKKLRKQSSIKVKYNMICAYDSGGSGACYNDEGGPFVGLVPGITPVRSYQLVGVIRKGFI